MMAPTFEIPGRVIFEMEIRGAPLPPGVSTPAELSAAVTIDCTGDDALLMEAWLRIYAGKDFGDRDASIFLKCAERIARARMGNA
jgi:hypothetical protein